MSLEDELKLRELSPIEQVFVEPRSYWLKRVPKSQQTTHIVEYVLENDGMALEHVSKKLITDEICQIAVRENGLALRCVPDALITKELCEMAVCENGLAFEYVPEKMRTPSLVNRAIRFYYFTDYWRISREERNEIIEKAKIKGRELDAYTRYPIAYVPSKFINEKMLMDAVRYSPHSLRDIPKELLTKEIILNAVSVDGTAIRYVQKNNVNKAMIQTALESNPLALEYISQRKITEKMCIDCVEKNPLAIRFVPYEYLNNEMCNNAFDRNDKIFKFIPDEYKTMDMCLQIINRGEYSYYDYSSQHIFFSEIPQDVRNNVSVLEIIAEREGTTQLLNWNERVIEKNNLGNGNGIEPLCEVAIAYLLEKREANIKRSQEKQEQSSLGRKMYELATMDSKLLMSPLDTSNVSNLPIGYEDERVLHNFSVEENNSKTFYYVTDIHLEHQLENVVECAIKEKKLIVQEVIQFMNQKIQEMVSTAEDNNATLLVGGDVAYCKELEILFYRILKEYWKGDVIFVLGNHELWDGNADIVSKGEVRTVDEIVDEYRKRVNDRECDDSERLYRTYILENDVYIVYKNKSFDGERVIRENQILNASDEELTELLNKASTIILGGIGFSGLNPKYNAEMGLYRSTVNSLERDMELSERFCKVYNKLQSCAGNKQVIVLTHTPIFDWTSEACNPKWIYINGHTHHNQLIIDDDATILSDNQIGYKPKKWKLNAFSTSGWYDPFKEYQDGIYKITSEEYKDFNRGRGIDSNGCNYKGQIYMLKRDGLYMFLFDSLRSLCLLSGGKRKVLDNFKVDYYYKNMSVYGQIVRSAIEPYQQAVQAISKEVKSFGGTGRIHGCIVDISYFSHIYINPFDGKVTAYWALDMMARLPFNNIQELLEEKEPELIERFRIEYQKNELPILEKYMMSTSCDNKLATIPKWVLGTEMYTPSRIMRAVQYIWSQNVIRIWNDDVIQEKLNQSKKLEKGNDYLIEGNRW